MATILLETQSHGRVQLKLDKVKHANSVLVAVWPNALANEAGKAIDQAASVIVVQPADVKRIQEAMNVPPVALAWGTNHPDSGTIGDNISYDWVGGKAPYQVIVTNSAGAEIDNKAPTSSPYTFATGAHPAGDYTVKVVDANADEITQAVTLAAAVIQITNNSATEATAFECSTGDSIANFVDYPANHSATSEKIHSDFDVVIAPSTVAEMTWSDPAYTVTIKSGQTSGTKFTITMTQKNNKSNVIVAHGKVK